MKETIFDNIKFHKTLKALKELKEIKTYLEKSSYGYEILREESSDDDSFITWKSENGEDGLPLFYIGNSPYWKECGEYKLVFNFKDGEIFFSYFPAGYSRNKKKVSLDGQGLPYFYSIEEKIAIMSLEEEWNDKIRERRLYLRPYLLLKGSNITSYLSWYFCYSWPCDFLSYKEEDDLGVFKNEFVNITMHTCHSPEMSSFIKDKIFHFQ